MQRWIFGLLFFQGLAASPWLTGPLIAPPGQVVPSGEFLVKSYLYGIVHKEADPEAWYAADKHFYSVSPQFLCFFGLTPWCDLNIAPQFFYNQVSSQRYVYPGDLTVGLDFQLFSWVKLAVREIFPTGNFQNFHPRKLLTDQTGMGTFATQFDLVFYKLFHLDHLHWLSATMSAQYTVNTPVQVHGFNTYGGGFGTKGRALPGNAFQGVVSFEVTLNQHWALALDNVYTYRESTQFYGLPGISFSGTYAHVGAPSSQQVSFAPAIEYNFSKSFGIIAGCWLSAWGRNTPAFQGAVVNFEWKGL